MGFMFETGLRGVEGKPLGLGKLPRLSLSKDKGKVFSNWGSAFIFSYFKKASEILTLP